jgi:hypothetical protein
MEAALYANESLQQLTINNNPIGPEGTRSMLRSVSAKDGCREIRFCGGVVH